MATSQVHIPIRRKIRNLLFIALITLLLFEVTLRIYEHLMEIPQQETLDIFRPGPTGSMRLHPNLNQPVNVEGRPFTIVTNSQGLAWRETPQKKPIGVHRTGFLGDSFTMGMWSAMPESCFVGIAEGISEQGEFINFGVGGYGFGDMRLMLEEEALKYELDRVVVIYFTGNDFSGTYNGLIDASDVSQPWTLSSFLYRHIALARFGVRLINQFRYSHPTSEELMQAEPDFETAGELAWIQEEYDPQQQVAEEMSLMKLDTIQHICKNQGVDLWVAALPMERQVHIEAESGDGWSLDRPQQSVQKWCAKNQVPYLDLMPDLRTAARSQKAPLYFKKEQHLTPEGHVVVGKLIGNWLRQ